MDEASSRFVDRLVMNTLLTEKLGKVHHQPSVPLNRIDPRMFSDFSSIPRVGEVRADLPGHSLVLKSPVFCDHIENRTARVVLHQSHAARGTILFVHGLFEDNRGIYGFLLDGLNRAGYSVWMLTLPFHYERVPAGSRFSGEFFWSADTARTLRAMKQAVYELYQLYNWCERETHSSVFVAGFSMGARVALILASLFPRLAGLFVINPAAPLSDIVWDSPLCRTIKEDYLSAGYDRAELERTVARFVPPCAGPFDVERICMAHALYDELTEQAQYQRIVRDWNLKHVLPYKAGHLNTLRVPRLAEDIAHFFGRLPPRGGAA